MLSELNGQENYFTRICVSGLLNTRKLELAHMLLQDINMFHQHPGRMPDANLDKDRLISSALANMELNDRRAKIKQPLILSASNKTASHEVVNSTTATTSIPAPIGVSGGVGVATTIAAAVAKSRLDEEIEMNLNDLTSTARFPSKSENYLKKTTLLVAIIRI